MIRFAQEISELYRAMSEKRKQNWKYLGKKVKTFFLGKRVILNRSLVLKLLILLGIGYLLVVLFFSDSLNFKDYEWVSSKLHPDRESWRKCVIQTYPGFPNLNSDIFQKRPILIHTWHPLEGFLFVDESSILKCPVPCLFVQSFKETSQDCWNEIDNFIFHPPTSHFRSEPFPPTKLPHHLWTLFFTEAEENYPILKGKQQEKRNMQYKLNRLI